MKKLFYISILIFSFLGYFPSNKAFTQNIPVNTWRSHLNFSNAHSIAITDNEVYCASDNALFSYEKGSGVITTVTQEDGLSDVHILSLGYATPSDQLIVLYANGNIDFITDDEIVNMKTLMNTSYPDKVFYGLRVDGKYLYVCASFGIAKINTDNYIIEETYDYIGENGSENAVFDITFSDDSLYIASNEGIKSVADDDKTNKQDFGNWHLIIPASRNETKTVLHDGNALYYNDATSLKKYTGSAIESIYTFGSKNVYRLDFWKEDITLVASDEIYVVNSNDQVSVWKDNNVPAPRQLLDDSDGQAWVADNLNGLIRISANGNEVEGYAPSGPLYPLARQIINAGENIIVIPPVTSDVTVGSFSIFNDGKWSNYTSQDRTGSEKIPTTAPFYGMAYNERENAIYFASNGDGLMIFNLEDKSTSIIKSELLVEGRTSANLKSLSFDYYGNLWTSSNNYIHIRDVEGKWQHVRSNSISSPAISTQNSTQDDVWLVLENNRLLTYKEGNFRFLNTDQTNGGLPSNTVYTTVLDNVGSMWIGTDDGSAEYFGYSPSEVSEFSAALPRYDGYPLLRGEKVFAYGIDGGNRKWVGTGRGLWLFSKDGGQLFDYFTSENSPLLSDEINTIGIQPVSGEVFIGTSNGIISYRSDATAPSQQMTNVKIFPSPVRPTYQGVLTITGLVDNASVKITDAAGNLVWDGKSYGGGTSWNLRLDSGSKPATGVYFVFVTDFDGVEKYVGKFALIQ